MSRSLDIDVSNNVFKNVVQGIMEIQVDEHWRLTGKERILPNYSTDINAAMLVFEEMSERGYRMLTDHWVDGTHVVQFTRYGGDTYIVFALASQSKSFPGAICLAALKTIEDGKEDGRGGERTAGMSI